MSSTNSLKHIFAQPEHIQEIGNIYPIKLINHDEFQECSKLLYISKSHFQEQDIPLLGLIFVYKEYLGINEEDLILSFEKLFSLVLRKTVEIKYDNDMFWFEFKDKVLDENGKIKSLKRQINFYNYDSIREIVMKQNLIFEQKIYKDPLVQEWANKVLESRSKNSPKITIEDFITTVKNFDGLTYDQIMEQSIYQLYADFYRIGKMKEFEKSCLFATVSTEPISIQHFAQNIDIWKSPYDDLFVDSSKLDKLNTVV